MTIKEYTYQLISIKDKLFRFAKRIVGNEAMAEDIVQDVVVKMWDKRTERDTCKNLEAYCMRITKNLSLDKKKAKSFNVVGLEQAMIVAPSNSSTPYQTTARQDTLQHIHQLIQTLPEKQQMVIQLRDIEGMEYKEIATVLDIPMNQVKVNLFRARKTIRKKLINIESYGL